AAALLLMNFAPLKAAHLSAGLVLLNANVHTMDSNQPIAQAVAVLANRIVAVGTTRQIRALAGPRTRTLDLAGKLLLPGFNDAHVHFLSGGFQLSGLDLRPAKSREEFSERIRRF